MMRIIWDHYMHGGNYRKMGLGDGLCKLCQQPDSAQHWMSQCTHSTATDLRARAMETVENHISTLTEEDPKVVHFVKILATCTTRHAEGYMHKIGMIPHERVAEIGRAMGIATVTENEREIFHREAVKAGHLAHRWRHSQLRT